MLAANILEHLCYLNRCNHKLQRNCIFFFSSSLPLTQCLVKIVILITLVFIHVNGNFNKEKNCNVVIETEQLYQPSAWI